MGGHGPPQAPIFSIGLSTLDSMGLPNPALIVAWALLVLRLFTGGLGGSMRVRVRM